MADAVPEEGGGMNFGDKAVLVSGAGRGLGRAIAAAFLAAGANVAVNDLTKEAAERTVRDHGGTDRLVAAPGDVGTVAGCEAAVDAALAAFERLDVLVNNAGIFRAAAVEDTDEALFEVFSQRYERGSTLVTTNLPSFDEWTEVLGSERLTGALLNRLTHHVNILEMNGDSYRLNQSRRRQTPTAN